MPFLTSSIAPQDYGALGNGVADDTTAIQNAITAAAVTGNVVSFPPGTYQVSTPITVGAGVTITGGNLGAVNIRITAGFVGASVFNITGAGSVIQSLTLTGTSTTYSSNPACDGIRVSNAVRCTLQDLYITYVNGFGVNVLASSTSSPQWLVLDNVHTYRGNQGIHILGITGSTPSFSTNTFIENCNVEQTAGADGLFIEDARNVTISNLQGSNRSTSTGNTVHIKGACAAVTVNSFSLGALDGATAQAQPVVLIESGANGTPEAVTFSAGRIQNGTPGMRVTAGNRITATGVDFYQNANYGFQTSGSASPSIWVLGCTFNLNGYVAAASNFDLISSITNGLIIVSQCLFATPVGTSSQQVASAVSANGMTVTKDNRFSSATAFGGGGGGFPLLARGNQGYNPVGNLTPPAVPASTVAQANPFGTDCTVYVRGGTVTVISVAGGTTGLTSGSFRVAVGQSITLTYSVAPTWTWVGD